MANIVLSYISIGWFLSLSFRIFFCPLPTLVSLQERGINSETLLIRFYCASVMICFRCCCGCCWQRRRNWWWWRLHYHCCSPIPKTMYKCNCWMNGGKVHFFFLFLFCHFDMHWGHISSTLHFMIHLSAHLTQISHWFSNVDQKCFIDERWWLLLFVFLKRFQRENERKLSYLMHMQHQNHNQMIRPYRMKHLSPFILLRPLLIWYDISIFQPFFLG